MSGLPFPLQSLRSLHGYRESRTGAYRHDSRRLHDGHMTDATTLAPDRATPGDLWATHQETLDRARQAIADRSYWSAYPESPSPKVYGESAAADGEAAVKALLGQDFAIDQPGTTGWVATETSPFGVELGVRYPHPDIDVLLAAAQAAMPAWREIGPQGLSPNVRVHNLGLCGPKGVKFKFGFSDQVHFAMMAGDVTTSPLRN